MSLRVSYVVSLSLFSSIVACGGSRVPEPVPGPELSKAPPKPEATRSLAPPSTPKSVQASQDAQVTKTPWPDSVDGALPAPQRAMLLGTEVRGEVLLALTGVTSKPEYFMTNPEAGNPSAATQETTYYVSVNTSTGCLTHSEIFPSLNRARTDPSQTARERLFENTAVKNELSTLHALFSRFRLRDHDGVSIAPDGKNIFIESSSFVSVSNDYGASFRDVGPGAAASPVLSPSGRYAALRVCGSPCGGFYKLTVIDMVSGVRHQLGLEDTEDMLFAPDDTLYSVRTNGGGLKKAVSVCFDQTIFPGWRTKRLGCRPLGDSASGGGSAISASGKFLSLIGAEKSKERAYVFALPSGQEASNFDPSSPIVTGSYVSDTGVFAFTRAVSGKNQDRALFAPEREASPGAAAGFLATGELIAVPTFPRATGEPRALQTLGDIGACNWVKRVRP
jgi:hypothetical protein